MLYVVVGFVALIVGWIGGAVFRGGIQADMLTRSSALYKEVLVERNVAITVLSKVKEELAQLQGNGHKRVVLASDLTSIRKIAGMPEASRAEPMCSLTGKPIVGG